jgi:nucleoid-associated protein YgaU
MSREPLRRFGAVLAVLLALPVLGRADVVELKPDHPERYTVQKGDTLWDIAARFLKSPWYWPKIWKINEQIANPHLIYPGDVIVLRWVDGKPELTLLRREKLPPAAAREEAEAESPAAAAAAPADGRLVKLQPRVHVEPLAAAIPTIPPNVIGPFLSQPLVVDEDELERAGYITVGLDNRIALGNHSEFYARGLRANGEETEYYQIFRPGKAFRDPDSGELLGYEAIYLGEARLLETGDPSKLVVTRLKQEILPADRLLVSPRIVSLPYYYPKAPARAVRGRILSAHNAVTEIGPYAIVAISVGERDGIEEGHVLRIWRHAGEHLDPVKREFYRLPDEESGLLMVFRTFRKMSYAVVMHATRPVHVLDVVATP